MKTSACGDMIDEKLARQRAHENNIARYRRLLQTPVSDVERHFIEQRLAEELTSLSMLTPVFEPASTGATGTPTT